MNNTRDRQLREFRETLYPAFSRRATQVCILSSALEAIAKGAPGAQEVAQAALREANPFGWKERACTCPSGDGSLRWPCPAHPPGASA